MKKVSFILALILLLSSMFSSCGKKEALLVTKNNMLYDESTGVYYDYADGCYEAAGWMNDIYIRDSLGSEYHTLIDNSKNKAGADIALYDPQSKVLIYNADNKLPTLEEMKPVSVSFFVEDASAVYISGEDDADIVAKTVQTCLYSPACTYPAKIPADSYSLKFASELFPYFLYCYKYVEYADDQIEYDTVNSLDGYEYREGVKYEVFNETDGRVTVAYNYGRYFVYNRDTREFRMATYIHDTFNNTTES